MLFRVGRLAASAALAGFSSGVWGFNASSSNFDEQQDFRYPEETRHFRQLAEPVFEHGPASSSSSSFSAAGSPLHKLRGVELLRKSSPVVGYFPRRRRLQASSKNVPRLQVSPLYGNVNDYAYYFLDVLVGTPAQRQSVILDTGSSLLGFSCANCQSCGHHLDPPFSVAASSTAQRYGCQESRCISRATCPRNAPAQDSCMYQQAYSEGSSIEGFFFSDMIQLDAPSQSNSILAASANPAVRYDYVGCHLKETVLFVSQQASGILGISFPKGGRQPTAMDVLFRAPGVNSRVFALCVAEDGGLLTVGGYNSALHVPSRSVAAASRSGLGWLSGLLGRGSSPPNIEMSGENATSPEIVWTDISSESAYAVKLSSLALGDKVLASTGFGEVLVDSGTTYSYFPPAIFQQISLALGTVCAEDPTCVRNKGDDLACWTFADSSLVEAKLESLPSFFVQFAEGGILEWKPRSWLFRKSDQVWCSALENNRRRQTILGMSFMKMMNVIVDRENDQVGFVSAACPRQLVANRQADSPRPAGRVEAPNIELIPAYAAPSSAQPQEGSANDTNSYGSSATRESDGNHSSSSRDTVVHVISNNNHNVSKASPSPFAPAVVLTLDNGEPFSQVLQRNKILDLLWQQMISGRHGESIN